MGLFSKSRSNVSRRRFVTGSVGTVATIGLAGCAGNVDESTNNSSDVASSAQNPSSSSKLAIIHTNDTHGHDLKDEESMGLAAVAQLRADWEAKGYEVLLLDAGDAVQGLNMVNRSKGDSAITFMNEVGYDAMALGNHEFDYGQDKVEDYAEAATFSILSANILVDATNKTLVDPSVTFTLKDGRKVGVFGLTTPETYTKSNPLFVQGLTFLKDSDLYACAQQQVDTLKGDGCDLVVCLGHLGESEGSAPNRAQDVVSNVSGIDLFIDGHDHQEEGQAITDASGAETLVVEADCYTHMIGVVTWEDGKLVKQLVKFGEYDGQDAAVDAAVRKASDAVDAELSEVIATTSFELNGDFVPGLRTQETNLGDLLADAILWEAQQSSEDTPDLAIINGGTIREPIPKGDITLGKTIEVTPFLNYVCTVRVTGAQLLEALEASCSETPKELGGFPQISGMTITVDTTVPYEKGEAYPESTYYQPAKPGSRVTINTINGEPFDINATYTVASSNYLCAGGDTYYVFAEAAQETMKGTGYLLCDALRYYLAEECQGQVSPEYTKSQGRIAMIVE